MSNVKLNYEQADAVTVESLLDSLTTLRQSRDIALYQMKTRDFAKFELENLNDDVYYLCGIETALAYFMTLDEFESKVGKKHPIMSRYVHPVDVDLSSTIQEKEWELNEVNMAVWKGTKIPYNIKK